MKNKTLSTFALLLSAAGAAPASAGADIGYEVWAADQSNSVAGVTSRGVTGSLMWIWDSVDIEQQLAGGAAAQPLGCGPEVGSVGPCDVLDVFPDSLIEHDASGPTGRTLADVGPFGRLHGMIPDPQSLYVNVNLFAPGGGFVGIVDGQTREAVALFRVTQTDGSAVQRSLHMSFWNADGSALLLANLHGKILERIDVERDGDGRITGVAFNQAASLSTAGLSVLDGAKVYLGLNQHKNALIGEVTGEYDENALGPLTPNGYCKQNGCGAGAGDGSLGGRPNNLIICPVVSRNGNVYVTLAAGGLLVADAKTTPMAVVGEYGANLINGAGCGSVETGNLMWVNAGVSASPAGATQSTFTMYVLDDSNFAAAPGFNPENTPSPKEPMKDKGNTATIGNLTGDAANMTGQLPGVTTRRDAHGAVATLDERYVHNVDRIRNNVEVFDSASMARSTYDLTSVNGDGSGGDGPCAAASVTDDPQLPGNDPAPDLMDLTPDGRYLVVALRGPIPVSVTHSAQGSCPGVGIIELVDGGASGRMVGVLRTTNTVDTAPASAPGGHPYTGAEHSDPHGAAVRSKTSPPSRRGSQR